MITRLFALDDIDACTGKLVKFAPLIAGSVPVKFAAGNEVKFAPLPLNDVAVQTPVIFVLLPSVGLMLFVLIPLPLPSI